MNKYISKILIVLAVITLSLSFTGSASAEYPTYKDCVNATWTIPVGCDKVMARYYAGYYSNGYDYGYTTSYTQPVQPTQYAYAQPVQSGTPVVNNYYYQTNPTTTKTTTSTTVKSATKSTSSDTAVKSNTSDSTKKGAEVKEVEGQSFSNNLPALAFAGSGGFLPSSFWQWLLVAVLILVIVILIRLINRSTHKEAHGSPAH